MIEVVYETLIDKCIVRETFESAKDIVVKVWGSASFVYRRQDDHLLGRLLRQSEVN